MKSIAFISTDWNDNEYRRLNNKYGGVSYYRLIKPMEALKGKYEVKFYGADIEKSTRNKTTDQFYDWLTSEHDIIIVKQVDNATASQALIHWSKKNHCILVQDYDDDMLAVRDDQPASKMGYQKGGERRAYTAAMMSLADALIVSTEPLKQSFDKVLHDIFNEKKDIYVYPNYNDLKDWKYKKGKTKKNKIVIGWAGSVTHDADLKLVMPALAKILDTYENVHLELLGGILQGSLAHLTQQFSADAKKRIKVIYGTPAWDKYPELMMSQSWDIGIAPLIDDEFNRSKSHIKWMEYTMMGVPVIASNVYPYSENIPEGCAIISKESEWEQNIDKLINNPELQVKLANNSYEYIKEKLQWRQHADEYVKIIDTIFDKYYGEQ